MRKACQAVKSPSFSASGRRNRTGSKDRNQGQEPETQVVHWYNSQSLDDPPENAERSFTVNVARVLDENTVEFPLQA